MPTTNDQPTSREEYPAKLCSAGLGDILQEVEQAMAKFNTWPTDPFHALAVLGEEFGELTKGIVQLTYEPHKTTPAEVRNEAIQTAAMALRFVRSLDRYDFMRCDQHYQRLGCAACDRSDYQLGHSDGCPQNK